MPRDPNTLGTAPAQPGPSPGTAPAADLAGYAPVIKASELPPGKMTCVIVDRERVLLANVAGAFYALQDNCGHQHAPLSTGLLHAHIVECPLHFALFDVRTGTFLNGPVSADVPTREVRVEGDTVYVKR